MGDFWNHVLGRGDKEVDVAKSGDNYYSVIKVNGETVMTVVQPPLSFDGRTSIGGKVSVYDAAGNLQVGRSKDTKYGEPIILFNPNNKAGLQLQGAISESKGLLHDAQQNVSDFRFDV